jgi:CDP-diglyceride synthetase
MKTRIISGICMVPFLALIYFGGVWLAALCIFVGFVGVREFYNGFRAMDVHPSSPIGYGALVVLYFIHGMCAYGGWTNEYELLLAWLAFSIIICSIYMFNAKKIHPFDAMATMIGIIYIEFFSFHVVLVDNTGEYSILVWLVLLSAFGSDICAYFTGVFLGKHKLCPDLSPKKTIEGAVGGVIGSAIVCGLFGYFFCPQFLVHCIIIGFVGSVISMCGDLTASAYKRKMGIKDYGNLIPGHGGIMDRFDSVMFTAPFVYYYIILILMNFQ